MLSDICLCLCERICSMMLKKQVKAILVAYGEYMCIGDDELAQALLCSTSIQLLCTWCVTCDAGDRTQNSVST